MTELFRCEICGDPYVGDNPPSNCPFCGAHDIFIKKAKDAIVDFDIELSDKDKANAQHALDVEVSNAKFYFCASEKTDDPEGKLLFKALGKIEDEHASIWKKILKLENKPEGDDTCSFSNKENLQESHQRETKAIEFYQKAAQESDSTQLKKIFAALTVIETDHLRLSEARLG